jgi:PKD repeat protein
VARRRLVLARLGAPVAAAALLAGGAALVLAAPPNAEFGFEPASPEPGDTVTFISTTSDPDAGGGIASVEWDFEGDGTFDATGATVTHVYDVRGTRTVRMRVTDAAEEVTEVAQPLTVNARPVAEFAYAPPIPAVGAPVSLDASSSADDMPIPADGYDWELDGDGDFDDAEGAQVSHSFDSAGAKPVALRVTDSDGAQHTVTHELRVNAPPVADFTVDPPVPLLGRPVQLQSISTDDRSILSYAWELDGDGDFNDAEGPQVRHTFLTPGPRDVSLRVTDDDGAQSVATKSVPVNRRPLADFVFEPLTPRVGESILFSSTSSDPDGPETIVGYEWDLDGDGDFDDAAGPEVTHSYATPGEKVVRLRVTDSGGATSLERVRRFLVQEPNLAASFTFAPGSPVPGETVSFQSTSVPSDGATIGAQEWDLDGDGAFDDAQGSSASVAFATPGPKTVSLRVTDGNGFDIASEQVVVNAPPVAALRFSPAEPLTGDTIDFTSLSVDPDGPIASEAWDLDGDGAFDDAAGRTAARSFATTGARTVRLRVTDAGGASDVESVAIDVGRRPRTRSPRPKLISPRPRIDLRGVLNRRGIRITRLRVVRAKPGALVRALCRGRGCPARASRRIRSKGKVIRLRSLERRLRAGARIAISVTYPGTIGTYTTYRIRGRMKPPRRRNLCLVPGRKRPTRCPLG